MITIKEKTLEKLRNNIFKIIYLILLIALLAFVAKKEKTINVDAQTLIETEQLVKENKK
ncbi:MAG: hypothetical protein OEM46_12200 [Ignavibacteria bacterium]|nr:hypothetical protein [Ignavibacteria bacterium]